MILFLDENHSRNPYLLSVLSSASVQAQSLLDHFPSGTPDTEWLPFVGDQHWALLTTDAKIRYNLLERQAIRKHRLCMFYFTRNDIGGAEMGEALRRAIPDMRYLIDTQPPPFAASITRSGVVTLRDLFTR